MAERPIGERPSEFASWTRWLSAGLVCGGVATVAQWWPSIDRVLGIFVVVALAAVLAVWAIKELADWVKDAAEDLFYAVVKRKSGPP